MEKSDAINNHNLTANKDKIADYKSSIYKDVLENTFKIVTIIAIAQKKSDKPEKPALS